MAAIHRKARIVLLVLLPFWVAHASEEPKAVFPRTSFHFGHAVSGAVVEHEFVVQNEGSAPLQIHDVRMTAPLQVTRMPAQVAPGAQAVLRFKLDTSNLKGPFEGQILVSLNDPALPQARLAFAGQVISTITLSPMAAFFVAARRGESKQASIEIINHEAEPLGIEQVEHSSERFTTQLETLEEGRRYRLTLMLNPDGPGGQSTETILVKTSSKTAPVLSIAANSYLHERVYTFPDVVDLSALRLGDMHMNPDRLRAVSQTLMVYQWGGSDFQVNFRTDLPVLDLKAERGPKGDRYQTTITLIRDKVQIGPIKGSIFIQTNDPQFPRITVPVSGLIIER
jgi:Protein of unknown function (DUF1573)